MGALGIFLRRLSCFYRLLVVFVLSISICAGVNAESATGQRVSFNDGWLFHKGEATGSNSFKYDDSSWQQVTVPHDWAIEGPFEPRFNARNGGLPFHGTGVYRKHFNIAEKNKDKVITVAFDGVMYNAHVFINGKFLGNRPFGYIGFEYDLSPYLNYGDKDNVITVSMSPEDLSTRWYPGAGIYRDTWLEINNPVHIQTNSTFVSTPKITKNKATVSVKTIVQNKSKRTDFVVVNKVVNAKGNVVAKSKSNVLTVNAGKAQSVESQLIVKSPTLWDVSNPYLYKVKTEVWLDNKLVDVQTSPLGIRTIKFTADDGFHLNGKRVQIQGVCLHHDNGPLGAIANRRAIERKLEIMQSMGVNSIRTAHNPPSPLLVELADEMGILLQVESFDVWKIHKQSVVNSYNKYFDEWHEQDLRDMIKQFRNNPSVIM